MGQSDASFVAAAKADLVGQKPLSFQSLILTLHQYWGERGCVILQPYDMEVGAGTFHPATTLRAVGPKPWAAAGRNMAVNGQAHSP